MRPGWAVAATFVLACSSSASNVPDGVVHQVSFGVGSLYDPNPALVVLVVDDSAASEAQALRALVTPSNLDLEFRNLWHGWRYGDDTPVDDPASGLPTDLHVVVVHPSATDDQRVVSSVDDPRLALTAIVVQPFEMNALEQAVAEHAQENVVQDASAPYPLLEAMRDTVSLLLRERAPRDARESAIVASLPATWSTVDVGVLTSRDDASPQSPDAYVPPSTENLDGGVWYGVAGPCAPLDVPLPRLAAWSKQSVEAGVFTSLGAAECQSGWLPIDIGTADFGCGGPASDQIARDADGRAECVLTFTKRDLGPCDTTRGWADPLDTDGVRRPKLDLSHDDFYDYEVQRECEIVQLEGAARSSCESTYECPGCGAGFCLTDVPELQTVCSPSFRLVGRAKPIGVAAGYIHVTCNVTP